MNISLSDISVYHIFVCKNIGVEEMNLGRFFFSARTKSKQEYELIH